MLVWLAAALLTFTPNTAPPSGGTTVTIISTEKLRDGPPHCYHNFCYSDPEVVFDFVAGKNLHYLSDYSVQVDTPPHAPGAVDVMVRWGELPFVCRDHRTGERVHVLR